MEMFIKFIIWAAVIQGLLLGVIFITSRKHRSFANRLLGFFLLAFVFEALTDLLPINEIGNYSLSGYFTLPEVKMILPVLFLHFVLEKIGRSSAYHLFLKIHYLFAFSFISITLINVLLVFFSGNSLLDFLGWPFLERFYMSFQYYAFILTTVSFGIALRETWRYRKLVRNEFTDLAMLDINWLWQFIFVIAPIILFWGAELIRIAMGGRGQSELTIIAYVFIAIFNYFVSYKAFTHQTLFDGSVGTLRPLETNPSISVKSSTPFDHEICNKIKSEMEEKGYYLNQNLTIHDFAKEIQISARTISSCVNQSVGSNFNEWVNNYRVEKALKILNDKNSNHLSIEGIGIDSGFKSRSAMYTAFKRKTGQSPGYFKCN
jgi:AraC-like DNA-binding protein